MPDGQQSLSDALDFDETLVFTTVTKQNYSVNMSILAQARSDSSVEVNFEPLSSLNHAPNVRGEGAITGMDLALWRPVLGTTGKDKTLRLWNPAERKMAAMHHEEEPTRWPYTRSSTRQLPLLKVPKPVVDGFAHCRGMYAE